MRWPISILVATALLPVVVAAAPVASEAGFRQLITARLVAVAKGDWPAYRTLLDPQFVHISDLGARRSFGDMQRFVEGHVGSLAKHGVVNLSFRRVGSLAIVDAVVREHLPDIEAAWRETDVFVPDGKRWRYVYHHETPIPQPPVAAALGEDRLEDYVGHYRSGAGTRDIFTAAGGTLFGQSSPGDAPTALIHVAPGAFAVVGDPSVLAFIRDRSGRVTGFLAHLPSGQVTVSQREP